MQIKIFTISSLTDEQEDFNKFLRGHKILSVEKCYDMNRGYWTFAVEYMEDKRISGIGERSEKVDYKELLSPEEFERFSLLRKRRKEIAQEQAVPAFAIFTDKELAEMSKIENLDENAMMKIEGINAGRASQYGKKILSVDEPPQETAKE